MLIHTISDMPHYFKTEKHYVGNGVHWFITFRYQMVHAKHVVFIEHIKTDEMHFN